jgi:integrase
MFPMGVKNADHVRNEVRRGVRHLVIDFIYVNKQRKRVRFRRRAKLQTLTAARAEAARFYTSAITTGEVERRRASSLLEFVTVRFRPLFLPKFRPGTRVRYEGLLRQGLLDDLGSRRLDEIGPLEIRQFAAKCSERGVHVKGPANLLRTILRAAVEVGELDELPVWPKLYKDSKKLPTAPSNEEVNAMLAHAGDWLVVAIAVGALAGLRMGEVRALEVQDVDLAEGLLRVRRALSEREVMAPKSGADRNVPIHPRLATVLREAVRGKLPRARLILTSTGQTPTRQNVLARFKRLLATHGLNEWSFHSLRHYFVSTLVRGGGSVEAVRMLAGHSSLAVTARYAHATSRDLVATIDKLGGT